MDRPCGVLSERLGVARILLVDDEASVVDELRRSLRELRNDWTIDAALSGADALLAMDREAFDVVVSDMRMPGMNGAQLLTRVRDRHPATARLILSGFTNEEAVLCSIGPAHQFFAKPCEPSALA